MNLAFQVKTQNGLRHFCDYFQSLRAVFPFLLSIYTDTYHLYHRILNPVVLQSSADLN